MSQWRCDEDILFAWTNTSEIIRLKPRLRSGSNTERRKIILKADRQSENNLAYLRLHFSLCGAAVARHFSPSLSRLLATYSDPVYSKKEAELSLSMLLNTEPLKGNRPAKFPRYKAPRRSFS